MLRGTGKGIAVVFLAATFASAAAIIVRAAPQKSAGRTPELEKAVAELRAEYAAHVKDPAANKLRTQCDYFTSAPGGVHPDAVIAVLEKPLPGRGRVTDRECAYVKWQLLSALPEQVVDETLVKRLVKAYERAPAPSLRFGCTPQEKRQLDALIPGARHQDDVQLTAKLEEAVGRGLALDAPVIAYRDELYRRLPSGPEKFAAALHDAHARLMVASPTKSFAESLAKDLPAWALLVPDDQRPALREIAEAVGKLRFVESPPYYGSAKVRRGKLGWVTETDKLLTPKKFETLHRQLLEAAGVPEPAAAVAADAKPKRR